MHSGQMDHPGPDEDEDRPTVLIVDDDADLADLYAEWVTDECDVLIAQSGSQALDILTEEVDIVLLDRRMPNLSGEEALAEIREGGIDCRIAMVSAVAPDFDVLEMGFDDYLTKPVSRDDLNRTITDLLSRSEYEEQVQRYYSIAARCAAIEAEKTEAALQASEEYARVVAELANLRERLDDTLAELTDQHGPDALFRDLDTRGTQAGDDWS